MKKDAPAGEDVRKVTSSSSNAAIDEITLAGIRKYAGKTPEEISQRILELDKEWDIDRVLDFTMSAMALGGILSSLLFTSYSIALPILLLLFFIWHAFQGWCPPVPLLRYFKTRTRPEIDREKYALKAMRGDFRGLENEQDLAVRAFECAKKI